MRALLALFLALSATFCASRLVELSSDAQNELTELIDSSDLEKASFMDPEQWETFKELKSQQSDLSKKISKLDKRIEKLQPEKTKVIIQVAPPGDPGPKGPVGKVGPRGKTGITGRRGFRGPIGKRGKIGPKGYIGDRGQPGHQGFPGERGEEGARGPEGPEGVEGVQGDRGPHGPVGPHGSAGARGPNGFNGAEGAVGPSGIRGLPGETGPRGNAGQDIACRFVDVCGVCDGNEDSCAVRRTPSTCHAVGDPHYHTFDGFAFDYQVTGEFILAKHLNDFEVQNKQRLCPNPAVRCNMAMAVKAKNQIMIWYADWGSHTLLLNGQRRDIPENVLVDVTPEISYVVRGNQIIVRYKDATVRGFINPWAYTVYMDLYVDAPARWSNGRSLTGLCWTFNGNAADDNQLLGLASQFWVGASSRSLFDNPRRDLEAVGNFPSLIAPRGEMLTAELPPVRPPQNNVEIAFQNDAERVRVEALCSTAHGQDKRDCMFDAVAGEPGEEAASAAAVANLLDHEKLMQVCIKLRSSPAAQFSSDRMPPPQHNEGFAWAFWIIPTEGPQAAVRSVMGKGPQGGTKYFQAVTVANTNKIQVNFGGAQCVTPADLPLNTWTHIAATNYLNGTIALYQNGIRTCVSDGQFPAANTDPMVVGEVGMPAFKCRIGRLFYIPSSLDTKDVRRYSTVVAPQSVCAE